LWNSGFVERKRYEESMLCVAATTMLIEWLKNIPDAVKYITDIVQNPGYDEETSIKDDT